ncbi:hypothetical protein BpHYR1_018976 [Brachionus plicatilis]|uniref:Uncharacterized protein n=1 Tax=Brachionus plicatilis TaxID=10195 RepID=A0A3M7PWB0_BRAPC|nr:hypothetical protein BpHYR1_018976 [Brachionus plicatilis]
MASLRIGTNEVQQDVFVAVDLQNDCLIGFDYMQKVLGTRDKLKEIYSSLSGEEVKKDRKNRVVNQVQFFQEELKNMDSFYLKTRIHIFPFGERTFCNFKMYQINKL